MNQQCDYYGKLLCNACIVEVPVMGDNPRQQLVEEGKNVQIVPGGCVWVAFMIVALAVVAAGINFGLPWWVAIVGGLVLGGFFAIWLSCRTEYKQPVYRTVVVSVEVSRSKCCIACRQAVEHLRR
jgi:hypothetical protein